MLCCFDAECGIRDAHYVLEFRRLRVLSCVFHFQRAHRGLTGLYSDMETLAGDPGAFARFDLTRVPSPAFVVDAAKFRANLALLRHIGDASGARLERQSVV